MYSRNEQNKEEDLKKKLKLDLIEGKQKFQ